MQKSIGALNAALEANEAETFAGLWIQHEPALPRNDPRRPSSTVQIFFSALYFRRVVRRRLLLVASTEGFCFPMIHLLFIDLGRKSLPQSTLLK
jgi:hypothetical protein